MTNTRKKLLLLRYMNKIENTKKNTKVTVAANRKQVWIINKITNNREVRIMIKAEHFSSLKRQTFEKMTAYKQNLQYHLLH